MFTLPVSWTALPSTKPSRCAFVQWIFFIQPCSLLHFSLSFQVWTKMVKYDVRKNFADTRMRVKGRFVKKEDEALLREVMACA